MEYKEIRYRIPEDLYERFRKICFDKKLLLSKQMHEIVRKFVEVQEQNQKILGDK